MKDVCVPLGDSNLKLTFNGQLFSMGIRKQDDVIVTSEYLYSVYYVPACVKHLIVPVRKPRPLGVSHWPQPDGYPVVQGRVAP